MARTGEAAANPFSMPPEMEFFWLQPLDQQSEMDRSSAKELKVYEKSTSASRHNSTKKLRDADLPMAPLPPALALELENAKGRVLEEERPDSTFLTTIATKPAVGLVEPLRKSEKEIRNYVSKKREVFLAHMACDVKRAEIIRLEEKAKMKEEALGKSQMMLEEDTKQFEDFLQERIARAQKATKDAEAHAKKKQDKLQKIKQVKSQIAGVQSEIGKFREVREECTRYKQFLDKLTPNEWKDEQRDIKRNRQNKRKQDWVAVRMAPVLKHVKDEEDKIDRASAADESDKESRRRGKQKRKEEEEEQLQRKEKERQARKRLHKKKEEEERKITAEYQEVSSEEEFELHFKEPKQLMDTFTELEEKNLFLIQSSQETEQQLEELKHTLERTQKDMGAKVQNLRENIKGLEQSISQETRKCEDLRKSYAEKAGTTAQDKKLEDLSAKVRDVYERCGLATDHNPDTLQMLGSIESKIEELISGLDEAFHQDNELVMRLEWQKERDRRDRVREHRMKQQMDQQETRLKASLLRSQAPVFKKAGKQVMYRSPPLRQERREVHDNTDDEANARDHKVFGMYIDRKTQMPQTEAPVMEDPRRATTRAPPSPLSVSPSAYATNDVEPASPTSP